MELDSKFEYLVGGCAGCVHVWACASAGVRVRLRVGARVWAGGRACGRASVRVTKPSHLYPDPLEMAARTWVVVGAARSIGVCSLRHSDTSTISNIRSC